MKKKGSKIQQGRTKSAEIVENLFRRSKQETSEVLKDLDTSVEGLMQKEAEERFDFYGLNEVAGEKPDPWYKLLLHAFLDPFILVLIVLAAISLVTDILL